MMWEGGNLNLLGLLNIKQGTHSQPAYLFHSVERIFVGRFFFFCGWFCIKVRLSEQRERDQKYFYLKILSYEGSEEVDIGAGWKRVCNK